MLKWLSILFGRKQSTQPSGPFVSEAAHTRNRSNQMAMTPEVMAQLRKHGVTDSMQLKLEYFFYTNSKENAASLASELSARGYAGGHDIAAGDSRLYVITGWTTPMLMADAIVVDWCGEMCDLGYRCDCEFDGWGTNPKQ